VVAFLQGSIYSIDFSRVFRQKEVIKVHFPRKKDEGGVQRRVVAISDQSGERVAQKDAHDPPGDI